MAHPRSGVACLAGLFCVMICVALVLLVDIPGEVNLESEGPISLMSTKDMVEALSKSRAANAALHKRFKAATAKLENMRAEKALRRSKCTEKLLKLRRENAALHKENTRLRPLLHNSASAKHKMDNLREADERALEHRKMLFEQDKADFRKRLSKLKRKERELTRFARNQNARQQQLIQWYNEVMKERKKLKKKQPKTINYDKIRNNVDAAFNQWASKQHFASTADPQVDNGGQPVTMADIDAAYAAYTTRGAQHARATARARAGVTAGASQMGAQRSILNDFFQEAPQERPPSPASYRQTKPHPSNRHFQTVEKRGAAGLADFFGDDVNSRAPAMQGHVQQGAEPEMMQAAPNNMVPRGYHMSRVCDEHGCLTKAVPDNQVDPRYSTAANPSNSMAAIDAAFNKWRSAKGITQTLTSDPPPTMMPRQQLSRADLEELGVSVPP